MTDMVHEMYAEKYEMVAGSQDPEIVKSRIFADLLPIWDDFVRWEDFNGIRERAEWKQMVHRMKVACKGTVVSLHTFIEE